jgi:hypothetical protein
VSREVCGGQIREHEFMSEYDLSSLIYSAMGQATSLFEFWLSASFALALVAYFAAGKLNGPLLKLLSIVYLLASIAFIFGWFSFSSQVSDYMALMEQDGYQTDHFKSVSAYIHGVGILGVFATGTIGVLYYLRWVQRGLSNAT